MAFDRGEAAPHTVGLVGLDRVFEALLGHRAGRRRSPWPPTAKVSETGKNTDVSAPLQAASSKKSAGGEAALPDMDRRNAAPGPVIPGGPGTRSGRRLSGRAATRPDGPARAAPAPGRQRSPRRGQRSRPSSVRSPIVDEDRIVRIRLVLERDHVRAGRHLDADEARGDHHRLRPGRRRRSPSSAGRTTPSAPHRPAGWRARSR